MDPRIILFRLIGESMVSFRKALIESETPTSLLAVVRKLIPPKGIKHKNQEGYEMLDFICPDDAQEDDYENLFDNLFSSQMEFEKGANGNLSESARAVPTNVFTMQLRPFSLMNRRLKPLGQSLFI